MLKQMSKIKKPTQENLQSRVFIGFNTLQRILLFGMSNICLASGAKLRDQQQHKHKQDHPTLLVVSYDFDTAPSHCYTAADLQTLHSIFRSLTELFRTLLAMSHHDRE